MEEHATVPLAGGLVNYGYQCGMLWGAALAGGAQAYKLYGPASQTAALAIMVSQRVLESFRARFKEINCLEITDLNMRGKIQPLKLLKFFIKGGPVGCLNMAVKYSRIAFREINASLSEKPIEIPKPPISCAAMLAQKMGASDMHTVMAAGFAGGIGLSGGGCGALGAALWIKGMKDARENASLKDIIARGGEMMNEFIRSADFKVECSEIVGRKFENISEHASYLHDGGCSEIIDILANQ